MKKKNIKLLGIVLILLFTLNTFGTILNNGVIPATQQKKSEIDSNIEITNEEIINEKPLEEEPPKPANSYESGLNYSLDTRIVEIANNSWTYKNHNLTGAGQAGPDYMFQYGYNGCNATFKFYLTGLINTSSSSEEVLSPSDFPDFIFTNYAGYQIGWDHIADIDDDGPGKGNCSGFVSLNATLGEFGAFTIEYLPDYTTNIRFNATLNFINATSNRTKKATFIPTIENTQSDFIEWELEFDNTYYFDYPFYSLPDEYKARIKLDNSYTISSVLGKTGPYWDPLTYDRNATHLTIYGSYLNYKITFTSPNYISINYNEKLEMQVKNELHLNVTCKLNGDLTIKFTDTNGTTFTEEFIGVLQDDIIDYNYIMKSHSFGGIGYLNITLTTGSNTQLGVKIAEVEFYKHAFIFGFTNNVTAFEPNFFIGAAYLDGDYLSYIAYSEGKTLENDPIYCVNKTVIANASITYELADYSGDLPYIKHPLAANLWLYFVIIDLRELQIRPDEYNITFEASKSSYDSSTHVLKPWIVYKRNATVAILGAPDELEVEEEFTLTVNLYVNYTDEWGFLYMTENYLRIPATVNLTFINIATGEMDGPNPWGQNIVQSFTLFDEEGNLPKVTNDTIPGFYRINLTLDSLYYQGSDEHIVEILKKELEISTEYSGIIKESINKNFTWNLEAGDFNKENMTIEILIDGIFIKNVSLATNSSGHNLFSFTPGLHNITYRLISPFYTAEETIEFTVQAKTVLAPPADDDDDDDDDKEENTLLILIITLILIGVSILAIFLVISRHKVKAKRELDSELVALKTKATAQEQKLSLIESQIAQIVSIYWIIIVHSEQGTTMVEIADFRFEEVLGEKYKDLIGKGVLRDSALIGGFLTAIRNFSRETSGTSMEYQPVFNSQTDYSTIVDDNEIHRRILEGTSHFMAFVSSRGTMEISDILTAVNSIFQENYGDIVKKFAGAISPFKSYNSEVISYLHNQIRELQNKFNEEQMVLEHFNRHLREVQDKIGIKPKKSAGLDYK